MNRDGTRKPSADTLRFAVQLQQLPLHMQDVTLLKQFLVAAAEHLKQCGCGLQAGQQLIAEPLFRSRGQMLTMLIRLHTPEQFIAMIDLNLNSKLLLAGTVVVIAADKYSVVGASDPRDRDHQLTVIKHCLQSWSAEKPNSALLYEDEQHKFPRPPRKTAQVRLCTAGILTA